MELPSVFSTTVFTSSHSLRAIWMEAAPCPKGGGYCVSKVVFNGERILRAPSSGNPMSREEAIALLEEFEEAKMYSPRHYTVNPPRENKIYYHLIGHVSERPSLAA